MKLAKMFQIIGGKVRRVKFVEYHSCEWGYLAGLDGWVTHSIEDVPVFKGEQLV
jgi:hypothetical protein